MWFRKKPSAAEQFEQWRAETLARLKECLNYWTTHTVFWEENGAEAEAIGRDLTSACDTLAGIPFGKDARAKGYREAIEKELGRIEEERGAAEAYPIIQGCARKIAQLTKEWILL